MARSSPRVECAPSRSLWSRTTAPVRRHQRRLAGKVGEGVLQGLVGMPRQMLGELGARKVRARRTADDQRAAAEQHRGRITRVPEHVGEMLRRMSGRRQRVDLHLSE